MLWLSSAGECRSASPTTRLERWGLTDEIRGLDLAELLPAGARESVRSSLRSAHETGLLQVFQYSVRTPRGARHLEAHVALSHLDGLVAVVRDVTPSRVVEEAVLQLVSALSGSHPHSPEGVQVCSGCRQAHDLHRGWKPIGDLIEELALAATTHGICPDCSDRELDLLDVSLGAIVS